MILGGFDGGFDNLAIRLGGKCDGAALAACTRSTADTVEVCFVRLGRFVVDDDFDAFDVEAAGGKVSGEEEVGFAIAERLDGCYTLCSVILDQYWGEENMD